VDLHSGALTLQSGARGRAIDFSVMKDLNPTPARTYMERMIPMTVEIALDAVPLAGQGPE